MVEDFYSKKGNLGGLCVCGFFFFLFAFPYHIALIIFTEAARTDS